MTQPDELLPCPFCGYTAKRRNVEFQRGTEDREGTPITVFCPDCAATGPFRYCPAENADMALTAWNTRPTPSIDDQVDITELKHKQYEVVRGMLSDDKEFYGGYRERKGWNAAIDHITAHYNLTRKGD